MLRDDSLFPSEAASHHDEGAGDVGPWAPVARVRRFHDYSHFSPPWLTTFAALACWVAFALSALWLETAELAYSLLPFVVGTLLSLVAVAGWFPQERLEIDLVGRRLLRVPHRRASFMLQLDEITHLELLGQPGEAQTLVAAPSGETIFESKSPARAERIARGVSQLLRVPLQR